tara:strand:+ start:357 stop:566 length:210 start_codon:yes stop_codon:yes gene_type:complete
MNTTNRPEEVTMPTTHATTVTPAEPETTYHTGAYRIDCSVCGTIAIYRGEQFTIVEARRHEDYFENLEG